MSGERRETIRVLNIQEERPIMQEGEAFIPVHLSVDLGCSVYPGDELVPASLLDSHKQRIEELEGALAGADEVFCELLEGELCDEDIVDRMANAWGMLGIRKLLTTEEKGERCERCGQPMRFDGFGQPQISGNPDSSPWYCLCEIVGPDCKEGK